MANVICPIGTQISRVGVLRRRQIRCLFVPELFAICSPPTAISYELYVTIQYSAVPHKHTLRYNPKAYCTTNAISAHLPQRNTMLEVMHHHIFVIRYLAKQDAFVSHRMGKGWSSHKSWQAYWARETSVDHHQDISCSLPGSSNIFLASTSRISPQLVNRCLTLPSHYWYVAQGPPANSSHKPPTSGKTQNFSPGANSFTVPSSYMYSSTPERSLSLTL